MMAKDQAAARGVLMRAVLGALGFLALLAAVLYTIYWFPFRKPNDPLPRMIEFLPLAREPAIQENEPPKYAWTDREEGIVRIPIETAIDLMIERLPVREEAARAAQERERSIIPTDAGSGRFVNE